MNTLANAKFFVGQNINNDKAQKTLTYFNTKNAIFARKMVL